MKTDGRARRRLFAALLGGTLALTCLAQVAATLQDGAALRRAARASAVGPPTFDPSTDFVVFPDERVAFVVGPQLKAGSARNPYPWFDRMQLAKGRELGEQFPATPPLTLSGTVSVQRGSRTVTGTATRFKTEVDPDGPAPYFNGHLRIRLAENVYREVRVASVVSDTQLTLGETWTGAAVAGAEADTFYFDQAQQSWNYDRYYDSAYYDLALTQYVNYYRTGDERFLTYARRAADSWWASLYIRHGTVTSGPNSLPPRSMAYAGLMLRALDGRPEMWDYLHRQARSAFDNWVLRRLQDPTLYYDLREDGYSQLYAVLLAKVLPDSYDLYPEGTLRAASGRASDGAAKRAALLSDAERAAVKFFGRLQRADGSWRWDVPGMGLVNVEQPFMVGLYLESVVALDQLTKDPSVKASLRSQLERACRHLYTQAYRGREAVADMPQYRWRGMWYFWGGGTQQNPKAYEKGEGERATGNSTGMIRQVRHLNSTVHHAFGYAYAVTGDEEYLRMGEEVFDASYGERVDGIRAQADTGRGKDYAMNYRASGRYLVWRLAGARGRDAAGSSPPADVPRPADAGPPEQIADALSFAQELSQSRSPDEARVRELLGRVEGARRAFSAQAGRYVSAGGALPELEAALEHLRNALAASKAGAEEDARLRLGWAAARLKRARDRVRGR